MTTLNEFRQQNPEYNDMSDSALAGALHKKFYSDMPRAEFDKKLGISENSDAADTAALTAGAFQKGARSGGNPLNMIAGMGRFTEGSLAAMPVQAAAFKALGIKPSDVGDWAQRNAPSMDPVRYWDANPMTRAAGQAMYGHDPATALKDTESAYKATGAEKTGLRDFLTGAAEIAGEQLPYLATGRVGTGLAMTGASAALGGLGNVVGGEEGKRIGALAALGTPLVAAGARTGYNAVTGATRPLRPQGRQAIAETIVRESATDPAAASAALATNRPPIPNAGFTAAEMAGDRGLLSLQRAYMGRPGTVTGGQYAGAQIPDAFISARSAQNEGVNRLLGRMNPYANTDDASVGLSNSMRQGTFEPVLRDETRAWQNFRASTGNQVFDADPLQMAWNNLRRQPNIRPDRDLVPAREYNKLRAVFERGATDLDELDSIRKGLGDAARAVRSERPNQARVIDAHRRVVEDYINNLPIRDPATLGLYRDARNMTRAKNVAFTESNIGKAFERTGQNYDLRATKVADTAFASREALDDALRLGRANPAITTELRRNFVTRFMESARTTATDLPTGERVLSRAAMDRFLADPVMQHARAQLYNTPAKERIWNRIEDALRRMDATNRAKPSTGGSDTSFNLQQGAVLDGLVMRLAGKLTGGAAPTIANRFTKALLSNSIQEIEGMVANILLNPAAARVALARPTPGNLRLLQQISRPHLAPVAGSLSAQ